MRKFLLHTLGFLALFAGAFIGVSTVASFVPRFEKKLFLRPLPMGATFLRMPELDEWAIQDDGRTKVLLLGPSTLYRGLDPGILCDDRLNVFNGGSSGQRLMNAYYLLRHTVNQGPVDCLVLDVFPRLWNGGVGVESARDLVLNNPAYPSRDLFNMSVASQDVKNIFLAAHFAIKRGILEQRSMDLTLSEEDQYRTGGFVFSCDKEGKEVQVPVEPKVLSRLEQRYLSRIFALCEKRDIQLVVLIPPEIQPTPYRLDIDLELEVLDAQNAPIAADLFYDNHHLLGVGAEEYSHWMKSQLDSRIE